MASKGICKLAGSRPPSASLSSTWSGPSTASLSYSISACKWISKAAQSWPPSASLSNGITSCNYISKLTRLWPASAPQCSLDHGLQVHLQTRPITASWFARSSPPDASPNLLDYGLQVDLWVHSITASQCISKLTPSRPPCAYPSSPNNCHQVYLWVHSIIIFRRTSICCQAPPAASPDIPCVDG